MKGKRGAEITIGTIVIIILALTVLVFLIVGFSTGWKNLWDNISNLGGGASNVQTIVTACQVACSTDSRYDYCSYVRDVRFADDAEKEKLTCKQLEAKGAGLEACSIVCPKCDNQVGEVVGTECVVCSVGQKCPEGKLKEGSFSDVKEGEVCCKVACAAAE